ncbi:MAG: helix-turn-helix transcriptional regulator [Kofleriaceae bacterium]
MKTAAVLDCLAAGYRLDLDDKEYVRNLVRVAAPLLDRGLGIIGYTYDATPRVQQFAFSSEFDPAWLPPFYKALEPHGTDGESTRPIGFSTWGHMPFGQASTVRGMERLLPAFTHLGGARDTIAINARDNDGRGLWLGAPAKSTKRVAPGISTLYSRLSAHLTSAARLRATKKRTPEAVLGTNGGLVHAVNDEVAGNRDLLRNAVRAFDRARMKEARNDVDLATRRWRPLVIAQWSLLDEFDTDGKRFVVAIDNRPTHRVPRGELSEREHQVLTQAELGHTNKEIAYELGLSSATVRVLVHRAAKKLGAATRAEAIARFSAKSPAK